jgi:hypothetical protein
LKNAKSTCIIIGYNRYGETIMEKGHKKKYEKPKLNKIRLDPQTAVLGKCKNTGLRGPNGDHCGVPFPICREAGS